MSQTQWEPLVLAMTAAIDKIGRYTKDMEQGQFIDDDKTADAVFYNLQVLAEASQRLPEEVRQRFGHLPWEELAGIRAVFMAERNEETMDILWPFFKEELGLLYNMLKAIIAVRP